MNRSRRRAVLKLTGLAVVWLRTLCPGAAGTAAEITSEVRQITSGPRHHFFGYIGHVRTIPWNASGRYVVALRTDFHDRMPKPGEPADIVLVDRQAGDAVRAVTQTRAWNFQQGTMLYWNPLAAETQFFFNDRDPRTQEVFCVLFDISRGPHGERIAEFRHSDTPFGNSGVAQRGGWFLGLNYGRMARLRPVTGYPGAADWTSGLSGDTRLLVSFRQLADLIRTAHPRADQQELFINHTLVSRDDSRIFFFVRGEFDDREQRTDVPCVMRADGGDLQMLPQHIGGHPEWADGQTLIGLRGAEQILFDVSRQEFAGQLGTPDIFPKPGGDVALSPDGTLFVNGHGDGDRNYYTILRRRDGVWHRTAGLERGSFTSGDLRIDPAPCWNRPGTELLVTALSPTQPQTRQLFVITLRP
jgi:hypothetical protein